MPEAARAELRTRNRWRRCAPERASIATLLLGAASVAGYAPLYLYPLPVITLALFAWVWTRAESPRRAFALGWWFGAGFFLTGVSWVYVSLHNFGAMPAPLAALATLLFCAFLALFPATAIYGCAKWQAPAWVRLTLLMPALWVLTEWLRSWIFTGFPWLAVGYSQVPSSALAGYAPVLGVYGVGIATVASAGLIVLLAQRARLAVSGNANADTQTVSHAVGGAIRHPAALMLLVIWASGYGLMQVKWTDPVGAPIRVSLLQGNIPQDIKWTPQGLRETLTAYQKLALQSDARLIVFPETALPLFLHQVPAAYLESLAAHARSQQGDVLIGVPERLPSGEYYNSAVSVGAAPTQVYRKSHLVPFGEFIPLRPVLAWIVNVLAIPLQDFSRGTLQPTPMNLAGQRVAVNICYEDAFGEEIIRQLPEATLLVNVSNVAWFGRSIAPMQHLQISQTRALETGRYMLRATNTGVTGIVNERGAAVKLAPQFEAAAVSGEVQGYAGATPFVRWGNYATLALCLLLIAAAALATRYKH